MTDNGAPAHSTDSMRDQLRSYFVEQLGAPESLAAADPLFSAGVLDSFDIVQVLDHVNREFAVEISPLQVNLDNFDSIDRIAEFVQANKND